MLIAVLWLVVLLLSPHGAWTANTHSGTAGAVACGGNAACEQAARQADAQGAFVVEGCTHGPIASLVSAPMACRAYTGTAPTDYLEQAAKPINYATFGAGATDTCWLAAHWDLAVAVPGWTRQPGTHYLGRCDTDTLPPPPPGGVLLAQVTVTASAVSAVVDVAPRIFTQPVTVTVPWTTAPPAVWTFRPGATLTPNALVTLGGAVVAPSSQGIFLPGSAQVVFASTTSQEIPVPWFATGQGTAASPWVGWDTAITWAAHPYHFPCGVYGYTVAPNWSIPGLVLQGTACTTLKYSGTGHAVVFDGSGAGEGNFKVSMADFVIDGSGTAQKGLLINSTHHSVFRNLRIRNITNEVLRCEFCVLNTFEHITYSTNETTMTGGATNGMLLTSRPSDAQPCSANTIIAPIIEGVSGVGIWIDYAFNTTIVGGTSEANSVGLALGTASNNTAVFGGDYEANTTKDIQVAGTAQSLHGVFGGTTIDFLSGNGHTVYGGKYTAIVIQAATEVAFFGSTSIQNPTGAGLPLASFDRHYVTGTATYHTVAPTRSIGSLFGEHMVQGVTIGETTIAAAAFTDLNVSPPPFALILAVSVQVLTAIPTAATFVVIDQVGGAQLNEPTSTAAGSFGFGTKAGVLAPPASGTRTFRLTPNVTPGAATGVVRHAVYYLRPVSQ